MGIVEKIKLLWALRGAVTNLKEAQMKNGIWTTEFWTTNLIPTVGALWLSYNGVIPGNITAKIIIIMPVAYLLARTLLKAVAIIAPLTATTVDDKIVEVGTKVLDAAEAAVAPKAQ